MFTVEYHAENGNHNVTYFDTLEDACDRASDMVYTLTKEEYAGFPLAEDTYSVFAEGVNHTITVGHDDSL